MVYTKELEIVKSLLKNKGLPEEVASFDYSKLTLLGPTQIRQFRRVLQNEDVTRFELIAYLNFVTEAFNGLSGLASGRSNAVVSLFDKSVLNPELEFGRICLPLLSDIYSNSSLSRELIAELTQKLITYTSSVFRFLPQAELERLVSGFILPYIKTREDIVKDFRWMYYVASPEYDGGVWGRQFLPQLKKNQEILGERIMVGEKELAPTVENWLLEYDAFTGKPGAQREAFDRLHFVQNNPNAKLLSKENAGVLLKLCELYDWFSDPYVTEAEVVEFEDIAPATARPGLRNEESRIKNQESRINPPAGGQESSLVSNIGSSVSESSLGQAPVGDDKGVGGYMPDESRNVQGRLMDMQEGKDKVGLSMGSGDGVKTSEILRSDDSLKVTREAKSVAPIPSKMDSGLPSQGFVETGMTKPNKQAQKLGLTPSNFAEATSDRQASLLTSRRKALPAEPEEKLLRAPTLADLKAEAEDKKQKVQADIDRKLTSLRSKK